jgi:hypothetical protein
MKIIKLLILLSSLLIILNGCGTFSEAGKILRNEKSRTTDEFLIKKKEPLTQPPDFENIPKPGSINKNVSSDQNSIEKILKTSQSKSNNTQSKSSSTEESILRRIEK